MINPPEYFYKMLSLFTAVATLILILPSGAAAADITLRWDPNREKNLAGYKIYYRDKSYGEPYDGKDADQGISPIKIPLASLTDPENPQFKITGLVGNRIYFFVLTAYDAAEPANESDYSNVMSDLRLTQPSENFGINKNSDYSNYEVRGHGLTEGMVQILGNGNLLAVTPTDADGNFAVNVDFLELNEGNVELTLKQKESTSYPVAGIVDLINPQVVSWDLGKDEITITFDERNMQNAGLELSYRFNPSLTFLEWDGIIQYGAYAYLLSMKSIPDYEIISLEMIGITDAVGNPLVPASIIINDRDGDQMADDWEVAMGLDAATPNSGSDSDGDGFSNLSEYQARTDPNDGASSPIAIADSMPQPGAGILNSARVPDDTSLAVLIASVHGIDAGDPQSVRFTVDDGESAPYSRDLAADTMRLVEVDSGNDLYLYWAVYDRSLETGQPMTYTIDSNIQLTVEVDDLAGNSLPAAYFEFNIESEEEHILAMSNLPEFVFYESAASGPEYNSGVEVVSGKLAGARIEYDSAEPLTPIFGPLNEIEGVAASGTEDVWVPVNLMPHTVFDNPVKIFIPAPPGYDISQIGIYYYNGMEWQPACDKYGTLLPGGEGWMVAGSRVNHFAASPPLIEIQVYHFSAAQGGVVFVDSGEISSSGVGSSGGGGGGGGVACFIDTAAHAYDSKPAFGFLALLWVICILGPLPVVTAVLSLRQKRLIRRSGA